MGRCVSEIEAVRFENGWAHDREEDRQMGEQEPNDLKIKGGGIHEWFKDELLNLRLKNKWPWNGQVSRKE